MDLAFWFYLFVSHSTITILAVFHHGRHGSNHNAPSPRLRSHSCSRPHVVHIARTHFPSVLATSLFVSHPPLNTSSPHAQTQDGPSNRTPQCHPTQQTSPPPQPRRLLSISLTHPSSSSRSKSSAPPTNSSAAPAPNSFPLSSTRHHLRNHLVHATPKGSLFRSARSPCEERCISRY